MKRPQPRFFWKLFLGNALLLISVVGIGVWLIVGILERFYAEETSANLRTLAEILRYETRDQFDLAHAAELDRMVKTVGSAGADGIRITLVLPNGTVLADSEADPAQMESHAGRKEIIEALTGKVGESTRWSRTVSRDMKYVALPVGDPKAPLGVVRVSMAIRNIAARTQLARKLIWELAMTLAVAAVVLALGLARLWSRPISRITSTARSLSGGDLSARADVRGGDELAMLALSLNSMRDSLAGQLQTIERHRRTLELLLSQLLEGVVVAGPDGRIRLLNPAAARLLDIQPAAGGDHRGFVGMRVEECVSHQELRRMLRAEAGGSASRMHEGCGDFDSSVSPLGEPVIQETRLSFDRSGGPVSLLARASDIMLPRPGGPWQTTDSAASRGPRLTADSTASNAGGAWRSDNAAERGALRRQEKAAGGGASRRPVKAAEQGVLGRSGQAGAQRPAGRAAGTSDAAALPAEHGRLLVLTDVTELTRTLQMKADFAANASHELRTPLAAIRAAVETMATIELGEDPGSAVQFLSVIDRHSSRLEALVADLLDLSRLEQPAATFEKTPLRLKEVLRDVHRRFADRLTDKRLDWRCDVELPSDAVRTSRHLLRLILDNLVDNAIKFTDEGGSIAITCRPANGGIAVTVADTGCGIPPDEHDRVFERFYQVERARSGTMRGTGLGLSIVRHAVSVMGGTIQLDSQVGKGTRMTFTIPPPPSP